MLLPASSPRLVPEVVASPVDGPEPVRDDGAVDDVIAVAEVIADLNAGGLAGVCATLIEENIVSYRQFLVP